MKNKSLLIGLSSVWLAVPAPAIERPSTLSDIESPTKQAAPPAIAAQANAIAQQQAQAAQQQAPAADLAQAAEPAPAVEIQNQRAWMGVSGSPVTQVLAAQLKLNPNQGLVIRYVAPNSPAEAAGLQVHDVLLKFSDQEVSSQHDLSRAVSGFQPDNEVTLDIIRGGEASQLKLKLGARAMPQVAERGVHEMPQFDRFLERLPEADRQHIQRMLQGDLAQLHQQFDQALEFMPDAQAAPGGADKGMRLGIQSGKAKIRFQGPDGKSVEINVNDDGRDVCVRDASGEVVFEGPYNSDIDKAAVPDDVRELIEQMDISGRGMQLLGGR
ncbi:S1C family serine protease [Persicirhabdus sediminis]|uniref:PDZ domain-containing protein n=1 Tax=Persicirhabdus sediminis TaxID=454144 RepID=A0A8J7MCF0_9BACT|nr:PDZ domain-containing protein [Persicirhabdus sediminis]MBK1789892.1 PDZ domain-containing protein [Persicirhabdus sediminis]